MSNYYPPRPTPRRLERSRTDRVIGGVCGGVAKYLNMDPTLVRVLTVFLVLFFGFPLIAYLIALFVMPEEGSATGYPPVDSGNQYDAYSPYGTQGGQAPGAYPPYDPHQYDPAPRPTSRPGAAGDPVWGPDGAPWESQQPNDPDGPPARS